MNKEDVQLNHSPKLLKGHLRFIPPLHAWGLVAIKPHHRVYEALLLPSDQGRHMTNLLWELYVCVYTL